MNCKKTRIIRCKTDLIQEEGKEKGNEEKENENVEQLPQLGIEPSLMRIKKKQQKNTRNKKLESRFLKSRTYTETATKYQEK